MLRQCRTLHDRPLEPLLALEHLEPGLAEGIRERPEGVRVERHRGQRAPSFTQVARGRCPSELVSEPSELLEQLLSRDETPREEPRGPLGGVPGPEVLDDGLRMDARLRVVRELAHRRRAAEPLGRGAQLLENLLVRVAPAQARSKRGELTLVDAHEARLRERGRAILQEA